MYARTSDGSRTNLRMSRNASSQPSVMRSNRPSVTWRAYTNGKNVARAQLHASCPSMNRVTRSAVWLSSDRTPPVHRLMAVDGGA